MTAAKHVQGMETARNNAVKDKTVADLVSRGDVLASRPKGGCIFDDATASSYPPLRAVSNEKQGELPRETVRLRLNITQLVKSSA